MQGDAANSTLIIVGIVCSTVIVPTIAAFVALRVHKQRLDHERDLADVAELRRVLDSGAELLLRAENTANAMWTKTNEGRQAISLGNELTNYRARLGLWFAEDDVLIRQLDEIRRHYRKVEYQPPAAPNDEVFETGMVASKSEDWIRMARERVGARQQR